MDAPEAVGLAVVETRVVLDKFDGDGGPLVERIEIVDDVIVSHEFYPPTIEEA